VKIINILATAYVFKISVLSAAFKVILEQKTYMTMVSLGGIFTTCGTKEHLCKLDKFDVTKI